MTCCIQADDFTFHTPARIDSINFSDLEFGNNFQGVILWRIYSNANNDTPGSLLYSGIATTVSHVATGYIAPPASEYANMFAIPSVSLPAGTYWLALHNGPLTNNTNKFVYWEKAAGAGARPSHVDIGPLFQGIWFDNSAPDAPTAELIFQLIGVPAPRATAISRVSGHPQFTFTTVAGEHYRVEYKNAVTDSSWITVSGAEMIAGTGNTVPVTDSDPNLANIPSRFYRAVLL